MQPIVTEPSSVFAEYSVIIAIVAGAVCAFMTAYFWKRKKPTCPNPYEEDHVKYPEPIETYQKKRQQIPRQDLSNVTAIASASGRGTNFVNLSKSTFQVGANNSSDKKITEDQIDWEDEEVEEYVNGFIDAHNQDTDEKTQDRVAAPFKKLNVPKKQVNPRFIDADFYGGKTSLKSHQYVPDSLYEGGERRSVTGNPIELDKTLDGINYAAFIADAGAGKTTTAKRYAQMVLKKRIPSLDHIKLVRYISIASLDADERSTAYDLLFTNGMGDSLTERMKNYGRYWVKKHSHEILFVLDGLDQASWVLDKKLKKNIAYEKEDYPSVIFHNILRRNLLKHCKIVITSREHAMLDFPENIRPCRCIALNGLTRENQVYLILELAGDRGKDILKHLRNKAAVVLPLCETPVFLVFTVAVLKDNLANLPETMSEILVRVLVHFRASDNQIEKSRDVLKKLKQLAYKGTCNRRVLFTKDELISLGLSNNEIRDLVIPTPMSSIPSGCSTILEEHINYFFTHQSIQEALTALHICDMSLLGFKEFITEKMDDPYFSVVRRILLGVLLNPCMDDGVNKLVIGSFESKAEKQSCLKYWLRNLISVQRSRSSVERDDRELSTLIHECGNSVDDTIKQNLHSLHFSMLMMHGEKLFTVISVISRCSKIDIDYIWPGFRRASEAKFLSEGVKRCPNIRIKVLNLNFNKELEPVGFQYIGEIIKHCEVEEVTLASCNLSADKVSKLRYGIDGYRGKVVYCPDMDSDFDSLDKLMQEGNRRNWSW